MRALRGSAAVAAAVLTAAVVVTVSVAPWEPGGHDHYFGTLQTDPSRARLEHARGLTVAHLDVSWERFEPEAGVFDAGYAGELRWDLRVLREAGARVEIGPGLHRPPRWLHAEHPEAAFTDQAGDRDTATADLVFSKVVRDEAARYLRALDDRIGLHTVWAIRAGVSETGEFAYPPPAPGRRGIGGGSYWAYDAAAQGQGTRGRPPSVPACPYPGWRPGETTYRGRPFTEAQAARWYDWYLAALADAVNWQIGLYRELGHRGPIKVLVPGTGLRPGDLRDALRGRLSGPGVSYLVGAGAGFFSTLPMVRREGDVEIVATSLVDGSGEPRDNGCLPGDATVDLGAVEGPDAAEVRRWSSVRWVAALAHRAGLPISGESAGPQVAPYHPGVIADAARQMRSCGLRGLMWAFDRDLYDGTPGSSLADYAAVIRRYS